MVGSEEHMEKAAKVQEKNFHDIQKFLTKKHLK